VDARSPFLRLSFSLVMLGCAILFALDLSGVVSALESSEMELRASRAEVLTLRVADAGEAHDMARIREALRYAVERDPTLRSAGIRSSGGVLLASTEGHAKGWSAPVEGEASDALVIPISRRGQVWARVELDFVDRSAGVAAVLWQRPLTQVVVVFACAAFLVYALFLRRVLAHLDPATVIPPRVKTTLDLMAEGVLLLDRDERVVLANEAMAERCGSTVEQLVGTNASQIDWQVPDSTELALDLPWVRSLGDGSSPEPVALALSNEREQRIFMVKAAPVADDSGRVRGAIATFNEITQLQRKSHELEEAMLLLEKSRDEIRLQNDELRVLAQCDPLTGVSNRRSFMAFAEKVFDDSLRSGSPLSCLMVDIDYFKRVNDEHGHQMGDEVIQRVAEALCDAIPNRDAVCRYGGEEFCVLTREMTAGEAAALAESIRRTIAATGFARVPVSASFGVSSLAERPASLHQLIERADEALYESKENGRNRVTLHADIETGSQADGPAPV